MRRGDWMPTFTGGRFWPFDPRPDEVKIEDIAHHLAIINRFGGTSRLPLSVAQHSVLVSDICRYGVLNAPDAALWGLLHDAHEAYLGVDLPRPVKRCIPGWKEIEDRIQAAVCERFGLPLEMPAPVRIADEIALTTEARDLASNRNDIRTWDLPQEPLPSRVDPLHWRDAERVFLARFEELTR
jgi:uncharacterized protein